MESEKIVPFYEYVLSEIRKYLIYRSNKVLEFLEASEDQESQRSRLNAQEVEQYKNDGTISGGMLPKVNACLKALQAGVGRTHIIDGGYAHSLLLEIYTEKGVGTLIVEE